MSESEAVTPESVDKLTSQPDIDDALVGGALLYSAKFSRIINFQTVKIVYYGMEN